MPNLEGVIVTTQDRSRESFDALAPGKVSWFTLISGDLTTSDRMSAGIMELEPGGTGSDLTATIHQRSTTSSPEPAC